MTAQLRQQDPLIGRDIDGYIIEQLLGRGGMARVYRAHDQQLDRFVAIKVIDPRSDDNAEYESRFRKEARAVAQLKHANIVGVYRFGHADDLYYMAMDYVEGVDLRRLLHDCSSRDELLPHDTVLKIITKIGQALDHAHSKGIIHRDIKPSNIMLTTNGEPILTDFGLALAVAEGTSGDIFGSPHYIAPEQAISSAGAVNETDIYSLGVVLYEMLTGQVPFQFESPMQIAMAHMTEVPPDPREKNPNLHPAFAPILERVLAKEPQERYPNCAKLTADLRKAIKQAKAAQKSTSATPGQPPYLSDKDIVQQIGRSQREDAVPVAPNVPTVPQEKDARPEPQRSKQRTLRLVLLLLIFALSTFVALLRFTPLSNALSSVSSEPVRGAASTGITVRIEGPVQSVDNNILTIYGMRVAVDSNDDVLSGAEVGDMLLIEGTYQQVEGNLIIQPISSTHVEPDTAS